MGMMIIFLCIKPTAQMSRKQYYLHVKASSAVFLLFSVIGGTATSFTATITIQKIFH